MLYIVVVLWVKEPRCYHKVRLEHETYCFYLNWWYEMPYHQVRILSSKITQLACQNVVTTSILGINQERNKKDMRRLTTGIRSEKRVVWRLRRCENVIECFQLNQPTRCSKFSDYYLSFTNSSTCFGQPHAHHQELQELQ